jgi:hypothetical protein
VASEAMAKTNEGEVAEAPKEVAEAPKDDSAERDETLAKTSDVEAVETTEDAGAKTEQDVRTASKEDDVQKLGTKQLESNTKAASSFLDMLQAIAAEASDYSRRTLENRSSFIAKLFRATTFESAIQIQSEHAKTSYTDYIAYVTKMTKLRADLAKEFFKPIETADVRVKARNRLWRFVRKIPWVKHPFPFVVRKCGRISGGNDLDQLVPSAPLRRSCATLRWKA